ncbi:helix-turn-helix domain-containing protein [Nonomuraea sp. NPDC049709]|uniref:helix-turn-helix domain-containing protein n=1 Tax=Nonomuraea sp. NPDC049709 TaxID=3154736 RepID=UPI00342DA43D
MLSEKERTELSRWAEGEAGAREVERAQIVLACGDGASGARMAADLSVNVATVRTWRSPFAADRPAGLADEPRSSRRKADLVLSEAEQAQSMRWARRSKTAQFFALRAGIVLRCAEGGTNSQVGAELGTAPGTVDRWRARFIAKRLDGLQDEPRSGRPPSILLDQVKTLS